MSSASLTKQHNRATGNTCSLCGLPIGRSRLKQTVNGEELFFCCPGCHYVFQILFSDPDGAPADFKSTDLYRACVAAGIIPKNEQDLAVRQALQAGEQHPTARSILEDEADLARELTFKVDGMWCTACSWLIEEVIRRMHGVLRAEVHFLSDLVQIKYLPHRVNPEDIQKRISQIGYSAAYLGQSEFSQENKQLLLRLGVSSILTVNIMMISFALYFGFFQDLGENAIRYFSYPLWLLATPVVLYGGYPILKRGVIGLRYKRAGMDTLIAVGTLSAYFYSVLRMFEGSLHLYFDTASMLVTLVLLGKYIEMHARERVSGGITELYALANQKVRLLQNGTERWVAAEAVRPGDSFLVQAGERVSVDSRIVSGRAFLDQSVLTGESKPLRKSTGDEIMAGALVLEGKLQLQAIRIGNESSLGQMISLTQEALAAKAPIELLADRITKWFVPAVLLLAVATALALLFAHVPKDEALLRAVTVLVITCPCALGIAVPLAKVAAIATGRTNGILIRDNTALDKAKDLTALLFDKTGTITEGNFSLREIIAYGIGEREVLRRIASIEAKSDHFLAKEIVQKARQSSVALEEAEHFESFEAMGVKGRIKCGEVSIGNRHFMRCQDLHLARQLARHAESLELKGATVVFFGWNGKVQGFLNLGDRLRESAPQLFQEIRSRKILTWIVSGDSRETTLAIAAELGVDRAVGQALPKQKAEIVKGLQKKGHRVGMIGDGINDSAALAQADVGFATGIGANIMQRASGITIIGGNPAKILTALDLSSLTGRVIRQNLFFAFFYNGLGIPLAILGYLNPLLAVCAMFASSLTVIGNTFRITRVGKDNSKREVHPQEPVDVTEGLRCYSGDSG